MPNSDDRYSLVERALMEAGADQLQDLLIEAIDALIALHEARGWPRGELKNRISEELYILLHARWAEDDPVVEQAEQVKPSSAS